MTYKVINDRYYTFRLFQLMTIFDSSTIKDKNIIENSYVLWIKCFLLFHEPIELHLQQL